jgi:phosphate acyltransferase
MKIAIDAMGGDHAPEAIVEGSLLARSQCSADLVLVGDEKPIREVLGRYPDASSVEVVHTAEAITMEEAGPIAIRLKRSASICLAMRLLADGGADAVVSAGNSSATVAASKNMVGLFPGLRRPVLAVPFPTQNGKPVMLDAGAHPEAHTVHLAQSAALAHVFLKVTEGLARPRIGLLNIGQEPGKGTRAICRAFALLNRSSLNFVGNVEPLALFAGATDAVVCEGFVGNVVVKMYEGFSESLLADLKARMEDSRPGECGGLGRVFDGFHQKYHYLSVGGAPLVGVAKPVVVAHGRSERTAIASAVVLAARLAEERIPQRMGEELEKDSALADFKHYNAVLILEKLKKRWRFS